MTNDTPTSSESNSIETPQPTAQILAIWRHELRTPLNALIGYSEMLLEDVEELELDEVTTFLQTIRRTGKELLTTINSILDAHQIESEEALDLQQFSERLFQTLGAPLNTIFNTTQALLKKAKEAKHWEFVPDLHKMHAAAERFLELMNDILEYPTLSAGNAMPDWMTSQHSKLIEDSKKAHHAIGKQRPEFKASGELLLIVDDNEMNRDVLSRHLKRQGYTVRLAEDGKQALEMIADQEFALVLLDIVMPEMNGYQVLERLHQEGLLHKLPVIMISAIDEIESVIGCIEMGAEDFLTKPFNPVLLQARISSCLEKKRLRDLSVEYLQNLAWLAEEQTREQAAFMRIMVHELKSPVSASKMMADLLACYPLDNPKIAHMPERISARMDQLLQLIKDILQLAKVKSGDPLGEVTTLDLTAATLKECEPYRNQALEKGLQMTITTPDAPVEGRFDPQSYALILSNLVSNAVKYTESGTVNVDLSGDGSRIKLQISDSGIGIPQRDLEHLGKEFFRASNVKGGHIQGTGVGLAGVKHLVERSGGILDIESQEGEGSTFTVTLPLQQS